MVGYKKAVILKYLGRWLLLPKYYTNYQINKGKVKYRKIYGINV